MILRDSTNPFDIPLAGLAAVAGYADGPFVWSSAGWARFPASIVPLSIVVSAADAGDILDVERFDAVPSDCPGWADRFHRPGRRLPTIYCNRATIAAVRRAMGARSFDWWAATLDGTLTGTAGAVAVQWKGQSLTGGHFDESTILDPSWIGKGADMTDDEHKWLQGLFNGWFAHDKKLDALLQGQAAAMVELEAVQAGVAALVAAGVSPVQLAPLSEAVARLSAHLGVGTA